MFSKKRIEIIIEKPASKRACRILQGAGVTGYSILPVLGGFGNGQVWQRGTDISSSRDMVCIISITSHETYQTAIEELENLLGSHIGILNVSSVDVIRNDRF